MMKSVFYSIIISFAVLVVISNFSPSHAMLGEKDEKVSAKAIENLSLTKQPKFELLNATQQRELIQLAERGDEKAQKEIIERNYWGFIDPQYQNSIWGLCDRGQPRFNLLSWNNIEIRAIEDDQFAYALIDSYVHFLRWQPRYATRVSFADKFPKLIGGIQEKAEAGDINASFNLGVIYKQDPQSLRLPVSSVGPRNLAFEWVKRAAIQGHSLATSALGLMSHQGYFDDKGRNDVEALRWYLASKNNKLSQEGLRDILVCPREVPQGPETFHQEVQKITELLNTVWGRHAMHIELHTPKGNFLESKFAIPQLAEHYRKVVAVEVEALDLLTHLQETTPGFMMTSVKLKEVRDRKHMLDRQTVPPYVSVDVVDKAEYLTLGDKNVSIASQLLTYASKLEEKFALADKTLKKVGKYYKIQMDLGISELMIRRLVALKNQDEPSSQRFKEQEKHVEELELMLKPPLQEVEEERLLLTEVKENIKSLIPHKVGSRNHDFREEHPYLN